jgi:hypothetical protein
MVVQEQQRDLAHGKVENLNGAAHVEPVETLTEDRRALALDRLRKKRDFGAHLLAYVLVNSFLWLIWGVVYATSGFSFPWPLFPLGGWGIGLTMHAWQVYWRQPITDADVERERVRLEAPRRSMRRGLR